MSPDRLRAWIKKRKAGATMLVLEHEQGLGARSVVATWTREEVETWEDPTQGAPDIVAAINDAGQDKTDALNNGTRVRTNFLLSWQAEGGRMLNSCNLFFIASEDVAEVAANSGPLQPMDLVKELLGHIHEQQKVMNGALGSIVTASRTTIEGLQAHGNLQSQQILALLAERSELQLARANPPLTEADLESSRLKAEALKKLIEFGPSIGNLAILAIRKWLIPEEPPEEKRPNGAGHHDA